MEYIDELIKMARKFSSLQERATPGPWEGLSSGNKTLVRSKLSFWDIGEIQTETLYDLKLMIASPEMAELLGKMANELEKLTQPRYKK